MVDAMEPAAFMGVVVISMALVLTLALIIELLFPW